MVRPDQGVDPLLHLSRGLVGEGDRRHLLRRRQALLQDEGQAVHDDAGLARAGAGDDEERPLRVQHRLALRRVEVLQDFGLVQGVGVLAWSRRRLQLGSPDA